MIRWIALDVRSHDAVRQMLRMAGLAGPWRSAGVTNAAEIAGEMDTLVVREASGCTVLARGEAAAGECGLPADGPQRITLPATFVCRPIVGSARPWVFPVYDVKAVALDPRSMRPSQPLITVRESGQHVALLGLDPAAPRLMLGFTLSDLVESVRRRHRFSGVGPVTALLRWWLRRYLGRELLRIDPWQHGRPPCLISFDIEGMVARRSTGSRVASIPLLRAPLLEIHRLDLIQPLRGRRLRLGKNRLVDPDGDYASFRCTIDGRKGRPGCTPARDTVRQYQLQFRVPRPPDPVVTEDPEFHKWFHHVFPRATAYYCGGIPAAASGRSEVGFHGWTHAHFHQMDAGALMQELAEGAAALGVDRTHRAVRAPGLLWSLPYFAQIASAGFHIDSSFRALNAWQPIRPIQTAEGWWELPVTGNLLTAPAPEELFADVHREGGMLNMHCHDHEVRRDEEREELVRRMEIIHRLGFFSTGHCELVQWLERSAVNEIVRIDEIGEQTWRASLSCEADTAMALPEGCTATGAASMTASGAVPGMIVMQQSGPCEVEFQER